MLSYTNRLSVQQKDKIYHLSDEGIGDENSTWRYDEIETIRLKFTPTKHYGGIYQCLIKSKFGQIRLSNRRFKGLANFEYQNEDYRKFVSALHQRLSSETTSFETGMSKTKFIFELIASGIFFPLMLYAIFALGQVLVGGVIILLLLVRLLPYYLKNKPGNYQASHLPEKLLP